MDAATFHIDLFPRQRRDLPRLHSQFPAHPDGESDNGATLLLHDPPEGVFCFILSHLRCRSGGLRFAFSQRGGKGCPQAGHGHATDPGGISPALSFDLPPNPVPAQVL